MTVAAKPSLLKRVIFFGFISVMGLGTLTMSTYKIGVANAYLTLGSPAPKVPYARLPASAQGIARGREVAALVGCADCHGADYGGRMLLGMQDGATVHAPNLTRGHGGRGAFLAQARGWQAVRTGLDSERRALWAMPRTALMALADSDVDDVLTYITSLAPVDRDHPQNQLALWGYIKMAIRTLTLIDRTQVPVVPRIMPATIGIGNAAIPLGAIPIENARFAMRPPAPDSTEFGPYVRALGRCQDCHGATHVRPGCTQAKALPDTTHDLQKCRVGARLTLLAPSMQAALGAN